MPVKECGCCGRTLPASSVRFRHQFRDARSDVEYCIDCYNVGCDLETCGLQGHEPVVLPIERKLRHKRERCEHCNRDVPLDDYGAFVSHDVSAMTWAICPGSHTYPPQPVTDEELADVYRSLGVLPPDQP